MTRPASAQKTARMTTTVEALWSNRLSGLHSRRFRVCGFLCGIGLSETENRTLSGLLGSGRNPRGACGFR